MKNKWIKGGAAAIILAIAGVMGAHFEGKVNTSYRDIGGVWSICYGHTQDVRSGMSATDDQCKEMLKEDMGSAYQTVLGCITAPMTVSQAAAFTDAAYNLGPKVVCGSTLQRLANSGDMQGACEQLLRWDHVKGDKIPGLTARRQAEHELCVGGLQ